MTQWQPSRRWVATCVLASSASLLLSGCFGEKKQAGFTPPPVTVNVLTMQAQTLPRMETFNARLEAKQMVAVTAQVNGQIQSQNFVAGQKVTAGQSLYQLDATPFVSQVKALEAQIAQAQTALTEAQRQWVRAQGLMEAKAISQQAFEQAQDAVKTRESSLAALQAQLKSAQLNVAYTQVKAPISGIVSESQVKVGGLAGAYQTTLTTIEGTGNFDVNMSVPANEWAQIESLVRQGAVTLKNPMTFTMTLPNGEVYPVTSNVTFQGIAESPTTGTMDWRGEIQNNDNRLRSGMFVTVDVTVGEQKDVFSVPEQVVMHDPKGQAFVYVLGQDNKVERRNVQTVEVRNMQQVLSAGLKDGDRVITSGLIRVRPGMTVAVAEPAPEAGKDAPKEVTTQPQAEAQPKKAE